ncbi:unnamed protein product [Effrenium voratum]|uniref:Chloride channel protein n=1 Tax=Effrenium voratum TaxID=2562239 RepID=A0AA36MJF6_9DINO|nr:unnamed protein product [Effrenium voratum]
MVCGTGVEASGTFSCLTGIRKCPTVSRMRRRAGGNRRRRRRLGDRHEQDIAKELQLLEQPQASEESRAAHNALTFARWEEKTGPKAPHGCESVSYEMYNSEHYLEHLRRQDEAKQFKRGAARWLFLCIIGLGAGLVAVFVDVSIDKVFEIKMRINDEVYLSVVPVWKQYLAWVGTAMALASVAGILVCYVEVLAAGSGIPEIKCYLNGVDFPSVVGIHTLLAKAVGIVFSVGAGLPCGKEGPMIHSGAIIGAMVSSLRIDETIKPLIRTQEVRDLVAAGAASGVAAAFGAPLGSVLFAIEEGTSHMNPRIMMRLFVASSVATLVSRLWAGPKEGLPVGLLGWRVPVSFGRFANMDYYILEFAIFGLMAIGGGLLGALFNCLNKRLSLWRQRQVGPRGHRRFLEVLFVTFVIASFNFLVPVLATDGGPLMIEELPDTLALYWDTGTKSMKSLFHGQEDYDLRYLSLFAVMNFIFACWNYGVGVPSGLFVPSLLTGSAFGRIIGQLVNTHLIRHQNLPLQAHPGTYALIGACAMLAGTARITISLAMILMETCGEAEFGLPIFLAVMVAKWTGDYFNRGIYDLHIVEIKRVPFLEPQPERDMIRLQVRDVMARPVVTLELVCKISRLVEVLAHTSHHAYPVLYPGTHRMAGMLSQIMLRRILELGADQGAFYGARDAAPEKVIAWAEMTSVHPFRCKTPLQYEKLLSGHMDEYVRLGPYINRNSLFVLKYTSVYACYQIFRQLGLRHLPVLGMDGRLVGIVTRKDLILAEVEDDDSDREEVEEEAAYGTYSAWCPREDSLDSEEEVGSQISTHSTQSLQLTSERTLEDAVGGMGGAGGM